MAAVGLAILACTLSACWDSTEISDRAIIGTFGIDLDSHGKPILAVEVMNPLAVSRGTGGQSAAQEQVAGWVLMEPAPSIGDALAQIARRIPRKPFVGHVSTVIFGRNLAWQGVGAYLDYLTRTAEIRRSVTIAVCDTAVGLLQRPMMEGLAGTTLEGLATNAAYHSMSTAITLNEFAHRLSAPGIEPVAVHTVGRETYDILVAREGTKAIQATGTEEAPPRPDPDQVPDPRAIAPEPKDPQENVQGSGFPSPEQTVILGLAVFKGDRAIGFIDGLEARGFLWTFGGVRHTFVTVTHPTAEGETVTLELLHSGTDQNPSLAGNTPRMNVKIGAEFAVAEASAPLDLFGPGVVEHLERQAAWAIEDEARQTLDRVQSEFRSDIYGFGAEFHRHMPTYWRQVEARWDDVFPEIEVSMKIECNVHRSGVTYRW